MTEEKTVTASDEPEASLEERKVAALESIAQSLSLLSRVFGVAGIVLLGAGAISISAWLKG